MQYSKPMIELVFEIRRRVPSDLKPGIKLANPELLTELSDYYKNSKDTITKALTKELMALAGGRWLEHLENPRREPGPKQVTKVYRGQVTLVDVPPASEKKIPSPSRVYRGQIVDY
ncbi:hypothetical protein [Marinimicrobium sp. ABcell2]|uniref:hypothetical protein n=1 Tax=Marinimicrobium sp. ABcell2 TaxID=3069751 RepID=UPI0027B59521|nr:hypothetical protein [Marinimicrobium sp. ABcell2]MDQ2076336.1 hypothetical protein [Marinimicrobium sp. ABcell2]